MAERLLGNILGQSSNATSGGLLGGPSIFQTQPSRGQRRSALLSQAISSQGSNPYARLGAAFGGLIGMGGRAAGEGLGILQEPEQVRQSRLIREAQQAAAESGIDPVEEPDRFLEVIDPIVESDPLLKSGIRSQIIRLQRELATEPQERRITVTGGTPKSEQVSEQFGYDVPENRTFSLEFTGNRITGEEDITTEDDESRYSAKNITLGDQTVIGQVDKDTGRVFYNGRDVTNQATFAPSQVEQGKPGEFNLKQKQEFDLREARVTAQNYANTAEEAISLIQEYPDINTWVGEAASVVNNVQAEAKALARASGVEFDENVLDPSNYASQFDDLGIQNEKLQGLVTNLALQAAAASGQTGRAVSDKDMVRFIGEVGANARDPRAFAETLSASVNRTVRNLRERSRELYGEDLGEGITFRGQPTGFTVSELEQRQRGLSRNQAAAELPEGATLGKRNQETGAWEVYQDGKIIGEIQPD